MLSSIRAKVLLLFVSGMLIVMAIVVSFTLAEVSRHYTDLFKQRGQVAAQVLVDRVDRLIQLGLLLNEFLGFEKQCLEVVRSNPGVRYAALVDGAGNVLYQSGEFPPWSRLATSRSLTTSQDSPELYGLLISHPLAPSMQNQEGAILIAVDQDAIDKEVYGLLKKILLVGGAATVLGTLMVTLFLQQNLGTPASKLLNHILDIKPENMGNLPSELPMRKDEIGTIAHALDSLVDKLAGTQNALLTANDELLNHAQTLEKRVEERTRELRHANLDLQRLARTDALTGLPNRLYFTELLQQRFQHAKRHGHSFAVFLLDLNGFKQINDRFGHAAGDFTLEIIAHRIEGSVRGGDSFSRLGGDEFALVVEEYTSKAMLIRIADKIGELITETFLWEGRQLSLGGSIGIATLNECKSENPDELLKAADRAMYAAKRQGIEYACACHPGKN